MSAYAALVSLMNNINQIQQHTRLPISFDQKQSESLLDKVCSLIEFLEGYNGASKELKDLERRITNAAYAAEDIIETHVVDTIHAHSRSKHKENETEIIAHLPLTCLQGIEKVIEDMEFIKERAMEINEKSIHEIMKPRNVITTTTSLSSLPLNSMVGNDDQLLVLMERLAENQRNRRIIPIVGMGGIGKTTLTRTAYEKSFTVNHFDFRAWVSISQVYDFKRIVLGLLPNESGKRSDNELAQKLHKSLCGRRYLVVLDDMWSIDAWNMINLFLPDNKNGSRIIVTTRVSSVATHLDTCSLNMRFLDEHESWMLFCEKAFVKEHCPLELEEVGRKIVENCKGLSLSIVVIGGLLAKSERRKEYWEHIARDTKEVINLADDEQCSRILSLSYQNLPVHLKPCFLYIGAFSEDKKIRASTLIKLWVAEGFMKSNCSKELEVLGEEYIHDLISRNLIMIDVKGLNGKVKSFMIHDLLRDICLKEAKNEKFMYAKKLPSSDDVEFIGSQRRISFHKSLSSGTNNSHLFDTMKSGSMSRTLICDTQLEVLPLQNFKLVRILSCINTRTYDVARYSLKNAFEQVNSRLITINYIPGPTPFPSSLCLLWNLQILIVTQMRENIIAPLEIWEMTELRHLQFSWGLHLPGPLVSKQMNGQEGDITMKKLHTLKGIKDFTLGDEVAKRIPNIKKLNICYELCGKELDGCLKSLGLLEKLESLRLSFEQQTGSVLLSNLTFPRSLKKLTLIGCGLPWEDMSIIASLPHLERLYLISNAFIGPKWELDKEVFRCLKSLEISYCPDLVSWIAEEDMHFPCLEHLVLVLLDELEEIPSAIGEVPTLQRIELLDCSKSAVISAKNILEEQEDLGNMSLQIKVRCTEDSEIESLASENFQVRAW